MVEVATTPGARGGCGLEFGTTVEFGCSRSLLHLQKVVEILISTWMMNIFPRTHQGVGSGTSVLE